MTESRQLPLPLVDVTGTMIKPIDDWQTKVEQVCKPEAFVVDIYVVDELHLTREQRARLVKKLNLVADYARYLAVGMLKGTLKYTGDDWSVEQWMAHMIGEGADRACYDMLLFDAWRRAEVSRATGALREV